MRGLQLSFSFFLLKNNPSRISTRGFSINKFSFLKSSSSLYTESIGKTRTFFSSNGFKLILNESLPLREVHQLAEDYLTSTGTESSEAETSTRILLTHHLDLPPSYDFYYQEVTQSSFLATSSLSAFSHSINRVSEAGESYPVQYILGEWNFGGIELSCREPVLIPRPESEELAYRVIERLSTISAANDVLLEEKNEKTYENIWLLSLLRDKTDYSPTLFQAKTYNILENINWKEKKDKFKLPSIKNIKNYLQILSKPIHSYWDPDMKREIQYAKKVVRALKSYESLHMKPNISSTTKSNNFIKVLDIGSGTGALGLLISFYLPHIQVDSIDLNETAVDLSNFNAKKLFKNPSQFYNSYHYSLDDFLKINKTKYDLIISNPPYIPSKNIDGLQKQVKCYEDIFALSGGADGLDLVRKILNNSHQLLSEDGLREIWLEVDESHPELLHAALSKYKSESNEEIKGKEIQFIESFNDNYGLARFVRLFAN